MSGPFDVVNNLEESEFTDLKRTNSMITAQEGFEMVVNNEQAVRK